jgi:TonB-linked SusC/RagA family outer membrane protein
MRKLLLLFSLLLMLGTAWAQRSVSGRISDDKGNPLANVSVQVKGTNVGTVTNDQGAFTLSIPANARTLVISSIGYTTQELSITNQTSYNFTLRTDDQSMNEVVVVGYQQRKKIDEAGAITTIKGSQIENIPNVSVDKAMQGRAPGVLVQSNNGIPGGAITVRVRGQGSINAGNQPLYVVDGVQINTRNDASFTQSNPLAFLNPADIESIDILKDAASAAIYGAQASNGVVIITTKKGRSGKTKFNFNTSFGQSSPLRTLEVMNSQEFYASRVDALRNNNFSLGTVAIGNATNTWKSQAINELGYAGTWTAAQADSIAALLPTYDWQNMMIRNAPMFNSELSASGGNDKTTFYISGSYTDQSAISYPVDFKRGTLRADISNKVNNKLSFNTSINLSSFKQSNPYGSGGANTSFGNPMYAASMILPVNPFYNPNGTYYGLAPVGMLGNFTHNILAVAELGKKDNYTKTNQLVGNIAANYKIMPWLNFRSFFGMDYRLVNGNSWRDPRTQDGFTAPGGRTTVEYTTNSNFLTTQTLSFDQVFAQRHKFDGLAGFEFRKEVNEQAFAEGTTFPTPDLNTLNSAANPTSIGSFWTGFSRVGVFGTVNYSFDSRYLISLVGRYDGSSRFGANTRYGFFPSVKAAWNINNENFLAGSRLVNLLRMRVSYGQTGNDQIGNFDSRGLFGSGAVYNNAAGITPSQLANPDLSWEKNVTTNFGIDFGFLRNRISGSLDIYDKQTKDLLISQPVSWTTGFSTFSSNVGQVENRGVELGITTRNLELGGKDGFKWGTTFNITYNRNRVKNLYGGFNILPGNTSLQVGHPIGVIFTQEFAGVNPATGRPMWKDTLGNYTYRVLARDRVIAGDNQPEFWGGLSNNFSWQGFTLEVFFQYEYGRVAEDVQINQIIRQGGSLNNGLREFHNDRWTTPGQMTYMPRPLNGLAEPQGSDIRTGTISIQKADYIRLKNVSLSYDLRPAITSRLKLNSAKFYIQGSNLWTYDDWRGYDPEFVGGANGIIPQSKNMTVGLQLGF